MAWLLAPLALLIERVVGYPRWLYTRHRPPGDLDRRPHLLARNAA